MEMHINYQLHDCLKGELPGDHQEVFFKVTGTDELYCGWFEHPQPEGLHHKDYLGCFRVHKWTDVNRRTTIGFNVWRGKDYEVRYWVPVVNPLVMLEVWLGVIKDNADEEE